MLGAVWGGDETDIPDTDKAPLVPGEEAPHGVVHCYPSVVRKHLLCRGWAGTHGQGEHLQPMPQWLSVCVIGEACLPGEHLSWHCSVL